MKKSVLILLAVMLQQITWAQEKEKPFKVELHGFIGVSGFYDSRQSVMSRNGHIYLYPSPEKLDINGNDINAQGRYDLDASFSRIGAHISGPDILGAETSALLEGDFLGKTGSNDLAFRIRHAYVKLNWEESYLLAGQYLNPMFLSETYPKLVTINPGAPIHPLNRAVQIRYAHKLNNSVELLGLLVAQNDHRNKEFTGSKSDEWSQLPEADVQVKLTPGKKFFAAFTAGVKALQPKLEEKLGENIIKTDKRITSWHLSTSAKASFSSFNWKIGGVYGGNLTNLVMLGGVGKKTENSQLTEYAPLMVASGWTDFESTNKKYQPGLFLGYTANLGANEAVEIIPELSRSPEIGYLYAISPRIKFYANSKVMIGAEYSFTVAAYGAKMNEKGKPSDFNTVANHRGLIMLKYLF